MLLILLKILLFSVVLNLLMFLLAFVLKTDKLTDISYSITFIGIALYTYSLSEQSTVDRVLCALVLIWAIRLGSYLLYRIMHKGRDRRFDHIRERFLSFLGFWLMQGVTCAIVMIPAVVAQQMMGKSISVAFIICTMIALSALLIEAVADIQKYNFKKHHPDKHMRKGLWAVVQHPNYSGELLFWWTIFLISMLYSQNILNIVGPLWISYIIIDFSGINILQRTWKEKYAADDDFIAYQKRTKKLIPFIF